MSYAPWGESNQDLFGLLAGALATKAEIVQNTEGKDKSEATAADGKGTIVAASLYDERAAPSQDFRVKATVGLETLFLGDSAALSPYGYAVVTGIDIATSNGGDLPVITASGETGKSATNRKFQLPDYDLLATLETQLFGACTLANCNATGSRFSAKATMARPLGKSGVNLAHDISAGVIEVTIDVQAFTATAPTCTAESGWEVTKPLTMVETNEGYATGSVTLRKHMTVYVAP
jgi:hypothetical protein